MTLPADSAANRAACAAQCYDDWHGFYILRRLFMGVYEDVRALGRDEALTYRTGAGEALEVKWEQAKEKNMKWTTDCKPCPFCGVLNPSINSREIGTGAGAHWEYWVTCENCGATGPSDLGKSGSVAMWNLRREYDPNHPNNVFAGNARS
jgi:hypothetical protein